MRFGFEVPSAGSPWRDTWDRVSRVDPGGISEMDLCYKYFGVTVDFAVGEVEVVSRRGHVTLVDLALSVSRGLMRLSSGEDTAIGFTENDEVIHFRHCSGRVVITSSKRRWRVLLAREELGDAFGGFLREAHAGLVAEVPGVAANPTVQRFAPERWEAVGGG